MYLGTLKYEIVNVFECNCKKKWKQSALKGKATKVSKEEKKAFSHFKKYPIMANLQRIKMKGNRNVHLHMLWKNKRGKIE